MNELYPDNPWEIENLQYISGSIAYKYRNKYPELSNQIETIQMIGLIIFQKVNHIIPKYFMYVLLCSLLQNIFNNMLRLSYTAINKFTECVKGIRKIIQYISWRVHK